VFFVVLNYFKEHEEEHKELKELKELKEKISVVFFCICTYILFYEKSNSFNYA